ncbi:L,D-transpeptidase family protein [Novosphingobium tardum]|uniref:L,D-transpeptidase family protein n=1 Tax=Novosphingobium tardum TaxID=1538021 RepID=A0ABV8RSG1_9SPHN
MANKKFLGRSQWKAAVGALLAAGFLFPAAAEASAPVTPALLRAELTDAQLGAFYQSRGFRPLWLTPDGIDPAAEFLLQLVSSSDFDAIPADAQEIGRLTAAIAAARSGDSPASRARAELAISKAFAWYVKATRAAPAAEMIFEHESLRPRVPNDYQALQDAGAASSLGDYIAGMRWMHPFYAPLRRAVAEAQDDSSRRVLQNNLDRVRTLPASESGRYILVDAANARLWMYENGRPVDSMRVVVGKPSLPTPMISGYVRYAIVNPYWNVPTDLVRNKVAPNVLRQGVSYLNSVRYQVLSDWGPSATPVDPRKVDWKSVANGSIEARVRQLPGAGNSMGNVKFEFPNQLGIYLHDTPEKNLMLKEDRHFSSGCVRLEDADRLGRWLMRGELPTASASPEQKVDLPALVPVYVSYLTAFPDNGKIALGPDPYRRDGTDIGRMARGEVTPGTGQLQAPGAKLGVATR